MTSYTLDLSPITRPTREQFYQLCQVNPELNLERTSTGEIILMSPVGGTSGNLEARLLIAVGSWNENFGSGLVFSSSTIFSLPYGGDRSPDVAWVALERWQELTPEQQEGFPPLCPDFVIELRSRTDRLQPLQAKMQEYLESGLRLGWLINPQAQQVEIYRQGQAVDVRTYPVRLSGETVLDSLVLELPSSPTGYDLK
jgi:Uma2 family endonuclease